MTPQNSDVPFNFIGAASVDMFDANPHSRGITGLSTGPIIKEADRLAYFEKMRQKLEDPSCRLNVTLPHARLKDDQRGTIVSPVVTVIKGNDIATRQIINPQELRAALLMFDRIEVPAEEGFRQEHQDVDFLKN